MLGVSESRSRHESPHQSIRPEPLAGGDRVSESGPHLNQETKDASVRLVSIALRRYSRFPSDRIAAARFLLNAALGLYVQETDRRTAAAAVLCALAEAGEGGE